MRPVIKSLKQLLGNNFCEAVAEAAVVLQGMDENLAKDLITEEVDFLPESYINRMDDALLKVGEKIISPMNKRMEGAPTAAFRHAAKTHASPIGGLGYLRLGEDGRLYLTAKSEHYHTSLGHSFPGYRLIENAKALGISNATHNNTRGYITRLLEQELIRTVNGLDREDTTGLRKVLASTEPYILNRVINLETGSLAVEAGVKMMLARFYQLDKTRPLPKYHGRIPVFFIISDHEGGRQGNYHGTTITTQMMRDLWPEFYSKLEAAGILKVCPVKINDYADFENKLNQYNKPPYKAAGFLHEIVLMNYGGIRLDEDYLQKVYILCHNQDTPVLCDEIQSCMWYPQMYLFKDYQLNPDFVVIGKGFPGGQYAASRIITTAEMDILNQFGALVTNGQEELASLAYLITMAFAELNSEYIHEIGMYYERKINEMAAGFPEIVDSIQGQGHLLTVFFKDVQQAVEFTARLNNLCIDISAQTYKANCPPAALTKIPIISTRNMVDYLVKKMTQVLETM